MFMLTRTISIPILNRKDSAEEYSLHVVAILYQPMIKERLAGSCPVGFYRAYITKKLLRNLIVPEEFCKTAATYSPTVTQYHRRGEA